MSMPSYNQKKYIIKIFQDIEQPCWEILFEVVKGKDWSFTTTKKIKYCGIEGEYIIKILQIIKEINNNPDILQFDLKEAFIKKPNL